MRQDDEADERSKLPHCLASLEDPPSHLVHFATAPSVCRKYKLAGSSWGAQAEAAYAQIVQYEKGHTQGCSQLACLIVMRVGGPRDTRGVLLDRFVHGE